MYKPQKNIHYEKFKIKEVCSRVLQQPTKRKQIFNRIKAANTHGTAAGKWSARKAQALAKAYKKAGGGYKS